MDRLPIALHLPQELLPLSGSSSSSHARGGGQQPSKVVGSGAGYGPPLPADGTPLSRLVSSVLYAPPREPTPAEAAAAAAQAQGGSWSQQRPTRTEYDLVALPLTNGNWQERWDRMCTITASPTELDLGVAAAQADAQADEAETWRAGGGFLRTEVNITRSGASLFSVPRARCACEPSDVPETDMKCPAACRGVGQPHLVREQLARVGLAHRRVPLRL